MMKKFIPSFIIIAALFVFSFNTRWAIEQKTNTLFWHLTQFIPLFSIFLSGLLFGLWNRREYGKPTFWHDWGEVVTIGIIALTVYVFSLHYITVLLNNI